MTTTAGKLTKGARVLVDAAPGPVSLARTTDFVEVATLTADPAKDGRKLVFETDRGPFTAGPTAKVLLALDAPEPAPEPAEDAVPAPAGIVAASVDLDAAGRLTAESVVTVGERAAPVPATTEKAGVLAPVRLAEALRSIGFEPVTRWALTEEGAAVCQVRPAHP